MASPHDVTCRALQREYPIDGSVDHLPVGVEKFAIAGEKPVMPNTRGDVGDGVGVKLVLFDTIVVVVLVPAPVGKLDVTQPAIGRGSFVMQTKGSGR